MYPSIYLSIHPCCSALYSCRKQSHMQTAPTFAICTPRFSRQSCSNTKGHALFCFSQLCKKRSSYSYAIDSCTSIWLSSGYSLMNGGCDLRCLFSVALRPLSALCCEDSRSGRLVQRVPDHTTRNHQASLLFLHAKNRAIGFSVRVHKSVPQTLRRWK